MQKYKKKYMLTDKYYGYTYLFNFGIDYRMLF